MTQPAYSWRTERARRDVADMAVEICRNKSGFNPYARTVFLDLKGRVGSRDKDGNGIFFHDIVTWIAASKYSKDIFIDLESQGGNVSEAEKIFNYLRSLKKPITANVSLFCASAAVDIFLSADYRECSPEAKFLIHRTTAHSDELGWTSDKHRFFARSLRESDDKALNRYVERTRGDAKAIAMRFSDPKEPPMSAREALNLGFVHSVYGTGRSSHG